MSTFYISKSSMPEFTAASSRSSAQFLRYSEQTQRVGRYYEYNPSSNEEEEFDFEEFNKRWHDAVSKPKRSKTPDEAVEKLMQAAVGADGAEPFSLERQFSVMASLRHYSNVPHTFGTNPWSEAKKSIAKEDEAAELSPCETDAPESYGSKLRNPFVGNTSKLRTDFDGNRFYGSKPYYRRFSDEGGHRTSSTDYVPPPFGSNRYVPPSEATPGANCFTACTNRSSIGANQNTTDTAGKVLNKCDYSSKKYEDYCYERRPIGGQLKKDGCPRTQTHPGPRNTANRHQRKPRYNSHDKTTHVNTNGSNGFTAEETNKPLTQSTDQRGRDHNDNINTIPLSTGNISATAGCLAQFSRNYYGAVAGRGGAVQSHNPCIGMRAARVGKCGYSAGTTRPSTSPSAPPSGAQQIGSYPSPGGTGGLNLTSYSGRGCDVPYATRHGRKALRRQLKQQAVRYICDPHDWDDYL